MDRQTRWRQIAEMTDIMLSQAKSGQWNAVMEMEQQRQTLMQEFFTNSPTVEEADWIAGGIRAVMEADRHIMQLGKVDIDKLGQSLNQIQRGKKAQFAYQKLA